MLSKATFQENFVLLTKRKPNSRLIPAYVHCETIFIHLVKVTVKKFKDSLRNLYHAQVFFFLLAIKLFYTFCIYHFICPFREQPPVSLDLLSFSLIERNSIPYTFLLKTHILLSVSNHKLYFISSFCRLVSINHPKLCHL